MKKFITVVLVLIITVSFSKGYSQNNFGHIDFAKLYSMMPGLDSVKVLFEEYNTSIQQQYGAMQQELESKFMEYQANTNTMSPIIKQTKEAEINDLKSRMDAFEQQAAQDLQNKEIELTAPIIEQARTAVSDIAKENSLKYVFNSTEGLLLYGDPSDDIMDLVKTKLNITVPTPEDLPTPQ